MSLVPTTAAPVGRVRAADTAERPVVVDPDEILRLDGLAKRYGGVQALVQASFDLRRGEVLALIGENGAGKSTVVKILTGLVRPDQGTLTVAGHPVRFAGTRDSWAAGIAAIHQETVMFDDLTVAENIFIGHAPRGRGGLIDWAAMRSRSRLLLDRLEVDIAPEAVLKQLSVAQKHVVEIARALSHDARVLIMDEPTAALSSREVEDLFKITAQLRRAGTAILFISHKFEEIFRIADRYTVLRDGRTIGQGVIGDTTQAELVRMMVGRPVDQIFPKRVVALGAPVLEVEGLSNATEFADISFTLRRGEILGFYGLVGAGRSETMQALFGISRPTRGTVRLDGTPITVGKPADAIAAGLVYVPEDRQTQGAILTLGIAENIALPLLDTLSFGPFLSRRREAALAGDLARRLELKAAHLAQRVEELSGGNQQKVVLAKWLATRPKVIILDEPTKGIDVGSKAAVHAFMGELVAQGLAVILVSSEIPEILGLSDRIVVMHEGRIAGRFTRAEATPAALVTAAAGSGDFGSGDVGGAAP